MIKKFKVIYASLKRRFNFNYNKFSPNIHFNVPRANDNFQKIWKQKFLHGTR